MTQPDPDPSGALALLDQKSQEYGSRLSGTDYAMYAYASLLAGDEQTCEEIRRSVELPRSWQYRIAYAKGDYPQAIKLLNEIYSDEDRQVQDILSESVAETLSDLYRAQAREEKEHARMLRVILVVASLIIILVVYYYRRRKQSSEQEIERLLQLNQETSILLHQEESRSGEKEVTIQNLRKSFVRLYQAQFKDLEKLTKTYMSSLSRTDGQDYLYKRIKLMVSDISGSENTLERFERQIDADMDGLISLFRAEMGQIPEMDIRLFCYRVIGFGTETIAALLGTSSDAVLMRKSRLRKKIIRIAPPHQDLFTQFL